MSQEVDKWQISQSVESIRSKQLCVDTQKINNRKSIKDQYILINIQHEQGQ